VKAGGAVDDGRRSVPPGGRASPGPGIRKSSSIPHFLQKEKAARDDPSRGSSVGGGSTSEPGLASRGLWAAAIELEVAGTWADAGPEVREKRPFLRGTTALQIPARSQPLLLGLLRGQLAVSAVDSSGRLAHCTGVQPAGVIDALCPYDGSLGARVDRASGTATVSVWAPTAQSVSLRVFRDPRGGEPFFDAPMQPGGKGAWHARGPAGEWDRAYYQLVVRAFHPTTGRVEDMVTSDPWARCTSADGERSMVVDLSDADLQTAPAGGGAPLRKHRSPTDCVFYELHVRDFSANDPSVPAEHRGKFSAFGLADTQGTRHLRELQQAGVTHVHLLPLYDFATVPERQSDRRDLALDDPKATNCLPTSQIPQALLFEVKDQDSYNWGYDPVHFLTPEGSYASDPDGVARIVEMRGMVDSLHAMGLRVVLDVVYNHTFASGSDSRYSVLDKVVPGYYHRRSEGGEVLNSTCCNNTACEHRMMARLVVDDMVHWAKEYRVDGFRYDIMGHLMKSTVLECQRRLGQLTVEHDGVDGSQVYLYGEGWNFAEMVDNARGVNAHAGNLGGCGIGSFNDRLRDKALGGSPFSDARNQGFLTGLGTLLRTDPGLQQGSEAEQWAELGHQTDVLKLCMAGCLQSMTVEKCAGGGTIDGREFRYPDGSLIAFAEEPDETINYVACHDNRTLWDQCAFKAPPTVGREGLARMCMLGHAIVMLSQGVPFIGAGDELLRSKCLDRDSYNSGDWFNRIDWSGRSNGFGEMGLPPAEKNLETWPLMVPLLERADELAPSPQEIALAKDWTLTLLRVRASTPLLRLPTARSITDRVRMHAQHMPGVLAMEVSSCPVNGSRETDHACSKHRRVLVVINSLLSESAVPVGFDLQYLVMHPDMAGCADSRVREVRVNPEQGTVTMPPQTAAVLVERFP